MPHFALKRLVTLGEVQVIAYDDDGRVIGLRGPLDEAKIRDERFVPHEGRLDQAEERWVAEREWEDVSG